MKMRLPRRHHGVSNGKATLVQWSNALDRSMPGLRTLFLLAGLAAAAAHVNEPADYLLVIGLTFQCSIWFEAWWMAPAAH